MEEVDARPLVVLTPVYEDLEASARLFRELRATLGDRAYVVAVDDGSVRLPLDAANISAAGLDGAVIRLRRNVGHQRAIAVGLNYVVARLGDAGRIVVMDSDGEDLPASVPQLLAPLESPDVDVAVAHRRSRVETLRFRLFYGVYKFLFYLLTGRPISFGNFMSLKPAAAKRIVAMQELGIHVAACVLLSKLRLAVCPLDRGPRYVGQSQMNFVSLVLHGFRALMVFAEDVLVRVGIACAVVAALSLIGIAGAIALKVLGYATPGWFSVALGILVLVLLQTGALTLMSLMMTGVVRGGSVAVAPWEQFVESVTDARALRYP
jgi:glycosyltransferase involved in cell wall biosynthesis